MVTLLKYMTLSVLNIGFPKGKDHSPTTVEFSGAIFFAVSVSRECNSQLSIGDFFSSRMPFVDCNIIKDQPPSRHVPLDLEGETVKRWTGGLG